MSNGTWIAGKKAAASLDYWSYYFIVWSEMQYHHHMVDRRALVFPRMEPLKDEDYGHGRGIGLTYQEAIVPSAVTG